MNAVVIFPVYEVFSVSFSTEGRIVLLSHLGINVDTQLTLNYKMWMAVAIIF